jgi:hypothetical protein
MSEIVSATAMKPSELKKALEFAFVNNYPLLIKGQPGIGKSEIVVKACETVMYEHLIMHPVVSDPTDFKGMPWVIIAQNGEHEAVFIPIGDLKMLLTAKKPLVVFLDDLGQSTPAVQSAVMQLILARQINGHKISEHVIFVAATNRREDRANVSGILEPVKSRFYSILELICDVPEWIQWAYENALPSEIVSYIQFRPKMLNNFQPTRDIENSPCPRTVTNAARMLKAGLPAELRFKMVAGAAGELFAVDFETYMKVYSTLPSLFQIESDPKGTPIPSEISARFALSGLIVEKMTPKNITPFFEYLQRVGDELMVASMFNGSKRNPAICSTPAFNQFAVKYGHLIFS